MIRAVAEELAVIVALSLFVAMIAVWAIILHPM
jgi:hypothetical protein